MVYSQIWKDISFDTQLDVLDYFIADGSTGEIVHTGYAKRIPGETGVTIDVNRIVEEYLNPNFENIVYADDILSIISEVVPNPEAYKNYTINDAATSAVIETFGLLYDWSYEDAWNGENGYNMSNPINGHCDPRMKIFISMGNTAETSYDWNIEYDSLLKVNPSVLYFPYPGGSANVIVTSKGNWTATTDSNWFTIDVSSHTGSYQTDITTVVVTASSTEATNNRNGVITFVNDEGKTATVKIYQYGIILYVVPETHNYGWRCETIGVSIYYNVSFTISSDSDWLIPIYGDIPEPDGSGRVQRYDIRVMAAENSTGWTRTGVVTFTNPMIEATFTGIQEMRLDNKIIYGGPDRMYAWVSSYCYNPAEEWGANPITWSYSGDTGIGMLVFDNTVTKYNGIIGPGEGRDPYPREGWVWMYTGVTRINGFMRTEGQQVVVDHNNLGQTFDDNRLLTAVTRDDHFYIPTDITLKGLPEIPYHCFHYCDSLTTFTADTALRRVGPWAFAQCPALRYVDLGPAEYVGYSAFYEDSSLETVIMSNVENMDYDPYNEGIADSVFYYCTALTSVTLCNRLKSLPTRAFIGCSSLPSITIPNTVSSIGEYCFKDCTSLSEINIPGGVKRIERAAFSGDTALTSATLGNGVEYVGISAFTDCTSLVTINIPSSVREIGGTAFSGCTSLSSITIDNGVVGIYDYAFQNCSSLTNIVIPESTTYLGNQTFDGCTSLSSITLGSNVTMYWRIGEFDYGTTFYNCTSLCEIIAKPTVAPALTSYPFENVSDTGVLHCPVGSEASYAMWMLKLPEGWTLVADL